MPLLIFHYISVNLFADFLKSPCDDRLSLCKKMP